MKFLSPRNKLLAGLILIVCAIVLIAHWPALSAGALSFDDNMYLVENLLVQKPSLTSTWQFLSEVLEPSTVGGYYQPLAMISLMVDYALGGRADNLRPFHCTSLALHLMNTALIIVLLYMLFDQPWIAAAAGLLFGVHPMTVEPIPWIGERKTLLAAFFALWCLIFYVRFARSGSRRIYFICLVMCLLALMSKPTSTPLPLLLLLMDYWPLRRLKWRAVLEKLPFFALSALFALITYISQNRTAGTILPTAFGPSRVPLIICHDIIFYLYKIIWPVNLSSHYPFPRPLDLSVPMIRAGLIGSCILIPLLIISLRWTRAAFTGWLFFFVAIFPTIGVVGFTIVIASDKFAYLPSVGLLMVLASFLVWLCVRDGVAKPAILRVVVVIVLVLAAFETAATQRHLRHWRDSVGLFEYMLKLTPDSSSVHNALGSALQTEGKLDEAIVHFHEALKLKPNTAETYYNLANALRIQGKTDEAIDQYLQSLKFRPNDAETHNNLGIAFLEQKKLDESIKHFNEALRIRPGNYKARFNLGFALESQGKFDEALTCYRQALKQGYSNDIIHYRMGLALTMTAQPQEAIEHFRQALRFKPDWVSPSLWMVRIFALYPIPEVRDAKQAVDIAGRIAKLTNYQDVEVLESLAVAYASAGQFNQAIAITEKALELASAAKNDYFINLLRERLELYKQGKMPQGSMAPQDANRP